MFGRFASDSLYSDTKDYPAAMENTLTSTLNKKERDFLKCLKWKELSEWLAMKSK